MIVQEQTQCVVKHDSELSDLRGGNYCTSVLFSSSLLIRIFLFFLETVCEGDVACWNVKLHVISVQVETETMLSDEVT